MKDLIKELDRWFSMYIRLQYADDNGWVACYTCVTMVNWKYIQNGHFAKRGNKSLRFDEENCKPQCKDCNEYKDGCEKTFALRLDQEYYKGKAEELMRRAREEEHLTHAEVEEKIAYYKGEVKRLRNEKGL